MKAYNHTERSTRTSSHIKGVVVKGLRGCMGRGEEKSIKACNHTEGSIRTSSRIGGRGKGGLLKVGGCMGWGRGKVNKGL